MCLFICHVNSSLHDCAVNTGRMLNIVGERKQAAVQATITRPSNSTEVKEPAVCLPVARSPARDHGVESHYSACSHTVLLDYARLHIQSAPIKEK